VPGIEFPIRSLNVSQLGDIFNKVIEWNKSGHTRNPLLNAKESILLFDDLFEKATFEFDKKMIASDTLVKLLFSSLFYFFGDNAFSWGGYASCIYRIDGPVAGEGLFKTMINQYEHPIIRYYEAQCFLYDNQQMKYNKSMSEGKRLTQSCAEYSELTYLFKK
jgi:hypothetical protein